MQFNGGPTRRTRLIVGGSLAAAVVVGVLQLPNFVAAATTFGISGTVTAAGGAPLAGVCVSTREIGGQAISGTVTGADGTYSIGAGDPTGQYDVRFSSGTGCPTSPANYALQYYSGSPNPTGALPVSVISGATTTGIDAVMQPGGSITGTVTAATGGAPIKGVCIYAYGSGNANYWVSVTAADGSYDIDGLSTGTYTVDFVDPGPASCTALGGAYASQWYSGRSSQATADPVAVTAGQATGSVNASLVSLTGTTTSVVPTPSSATQGQSISFATSVTGPGGTPTGTVAVTEGNVALCTVTLASGSGTCSATTASLGNDSITATYSGDQTFDSSSGTTSVSVTIANPPPTTTTTSTPTATTSPPPVASPSPAPQHGYWLVGGDGGIFTFGSAQFHGSTGSIRLSRPVVGITPTEDDRGYWLVASDGGIFAFGDAGFYGSIPGLGYLPAGTPGNVKRLNAPVVGMVPSADGGGYFMVASDGGVFAFGDARFEGSCPAIGGCSGAAVAVMPDATGDGYWLVTATGHVYTFGDAAAYGSPGDQGRVTSAVRTPDGRGYWILFSNGRVVPFGDAAGYGSLPGGAVGGFNPATSIFSTADGAGYWVATANGAVYPFGGAPNDGSMAGTRLNAPIIAAVGW
jgi:hypothetical protein